MAEGKAAAWGELLAARRLGYFALLRNLRNILEQAPEAVDLALAALTDPALIAKSLVLPFRFGSALDALQDTNLPRAGEALAALSRAVDLSLANAPRFDGATLVAVDISGSMMGQPLKIAALFAAVLLKANADADLLRFGSEAAYRSLDRGLPTLALARAVAASADGGGTNFHAIFGTANRAYARIVILSDMQAWMGHDTPAATFAAYRQRHHARPKVFSFDLKGGGTTQFPEADVFALAGFSDKTLDTLQVLERDRGAFLREIEAVEF